jgi:ubiquinone/menaquinone biosynthesis C-methylase UbiE
MAQKLLEYPVYGFNLARFVHFKSQNTLLQWLFSSLPWVDKKILKATEARREPVNQILFSELHQLLKRDAQNIAEGIYPLQVLRPEDPRAHFLRLPWLVWDGLKIYNKRAKHLHKSFSRRAQRYLDEVPEYFRRNYHFQTDGYLSEHSAELYEHQVELLFSGAADAMRRILLRPLKENFGDGKDKKILEVACGTGRMTKFMKLAFPKAGLIATDVSGPYVSVARRKAKDLSRVVFLQADASQLPFKDESFDLVYSVFLFHELPADVRDRVVREGLRVLKPGGTYALVDSIQLHDFAEVRTALEQFPVDFHEPFYRHYIEHPMEGVLEAAGLRSIQTGRGFLSKFIVAKKPELK